jgi:hypothetical protein
MNTDRGHHASKIRFLNDNHRLLMPSGEVFLTAGIAALDNGLKAQILDAVRLYTDFCVDNDPHGEHDFGSFEIGDHTINWKIDYYDLALEFGSEKPWRPDLTKRVLTIMLAEER